MRSVILLIFDDADLAALPNCLRYLANAGTETLLIIHGPNVGVVATDATAEIDKKIAELGVRKKELTMVEDFSGAQRAKEEIEGLKIERDMKIRDGWRGVDEAKRQEMYKAAFKDVGTEPVCLREAYSHDQAFTMLQSYLPQWPSDLAHGSYSIIWPRSVAPVAAKPLGTAIAPATQKTTAAEKPSVGAVSESVLRSVGDYSKLQGKELRQAELQSMHHLKVSAIAKKAGLEIKGIKTPQLIKILLDKEFPESAAA